ncbi:amine oxidase [Methylomonas rivi]|uniref:Amine oxidase n=1 Tax=Methylomonas rivi TaxID=2952226 RepID=A0ABT1U1E5_9GAMM|nr:amine oxidase [Methylomonas sp. WSC-6]MCQ8127630.1 amine oxidase [Methylomonas sp. WSC-6]
MPPEPINSQSFKQFQDYLAQHKSRMKTDYRQLLARDLSKQQWDGCFQRNVLAVLTDTYTQSLNFLHSLPFQSAGVAVERGMSALTRRLLPIFDGFVDEFLLFAVDKHRTSCALSNFPDEHKPSDDYINQVKREIAVLWRDFALNANAHFLACP